MKDDQLLCALKEQNEALRSLKGDVKELDNKFDKLMIEDLPAFKLDVQKEFTTLKVDIAGLKVKASMLGAGAGAVTGILLTFIGEVILHFV